MASEERAAGPASPGHDPSGPDVSVAAVCRREDRLLLVRRGHGAAAGVWSLPGGSVRRGETLAESVVDRLREQCGSSVLCGPFLGWREHLDGPAHQLVMYFESVEIVAGDDRRDPPGSDVAEMEWVTASIVLDRRLTPGLAEFLSEEGLVDAVV